MGYDSTFRSYRGGHPVVFDFMRHETELFRSIRKTDADSGIRDVGGWRQEWSPHRRRGGIHMEAGTRDVPPARRFLPRQESGDWQNRTDGKNAGAMHRLPFGKFKRLS